MENFISVKHHPSDGTAAESVTLSYSISAEESVHTISCVISPESRHTHRWLALRKFDVRLLREKGKYTMLHNSRNDTWNRDTGLFIDEVWAAIMKQEALVCAN